MLSSMALSRGPEAGGVLSFARRVAISACWRRIICSRRFWTQARGQLGRLRRSGRRQAYHLSFLLVLELLVDLAQARSAVVRGARGPRGAMRVQSWTHLDLGRHGQIGIHEVEVHADAGAAAAGGVALARGG